MVHRYLCPLGKKINKKHIDGGEFSSHILPFFVCAFVSQISSVLSSPTGRGGTDGCRWAVVILEALEVVLLATGVYSHSRSENNNSVLQTSTQSLRVCAFFPSRIPLLSRLETINSAAHFKKCTSRRAGLQRKLRGGRSCGRKQEGH